MGTEEIIKILLKIDRKLGVILGNQISEKENNIKKQVAFLSKTKFDSTEIAEILGITQSHASKELSILKKGVKNARKIE
jgi:predicted transcriptional regulator